MIKRVKLEATEVSFLLLFSILLVCEISNAADSGPVPDSQFISSLAGGGKEALESYSPPKDLTTFKSETRPLPHALGHLDVRIGVQRPIGIPIGDVLYFHGFGDRLDNHGPLFDQFTQAGFRVISFDLPGHGEDSGLQNDLNAYSFDDLAALAAAVDERTLEDRNRPLILAGWSTGGLIAVRIAQEGKFDRTPKGLILFAPGVDVRALVGETGIVTRRTLTQNPNPPHSGPIKPRSPLLTPGFSPRILYNAWLSRRDRLPSRLRTIIFTGGEKQDRYVKTDKLIEWTRAQRAAGAMIVGVQCQGAFHELDNEPDPIGNEVRSTAASYARDLLGDAPPTVSLSACAEF